MKDKKSICLSAVSVFLLLAASSSLVFAQETGSIEVEIKYTNGDRINNWQTVLQVYQDDNDEPFVTVEFPESNPYLIESLPLGHKYTVEVYANNMFATLGFLNLDDHKEEMQLTIPLQGGKRFIVVYDDGQTPIEGAEISVKSHDGHQWSKGVTDSEGKTTRFWLQSNDLVEDEYYIVEVSLDKDLVYSHSPVIYFPGAIDDLEIKTPWPKIIEDLITVTVYKDEVQKVSPSDGEFTVEMYNAQNTLVKQSAVNARGDAFFSNLNVGKYSFHVIKSTDDPDQEDELWSTKSVAIDGKENNISIFKKGILSFSGPKTCNCVAFRLDDVQDYYLRGPSVDIMTLFQQKKADLTVGVIGGFFGTDPHLVDFLKRGSQNKHPTLEVASHSYNNKPLTTFSKSEQLTLLEKTNEAFLKILNIQPKVLIAPQNLFNNDTLSLLPELGLTHITAHIKEVDSPPYLVENLETYYFPANTQTAKLLPDGITWERQDRSVTFDEVRGFIDKHGYSVVMMHPYEFAATELGVYTGDSDKEMLGELGRLIDDIRDEGIEIVTISEIDKNIVEAYTPTASKQDDSEVSSCDCVAFRFAPVQDYWLNQVQIQIIDTFVRNDSPVTAAIVGNLFGNDVKLVDHIKNTLQENSRLIEIANNGWNYEDFSELSSEEQSSTIKQGIEKISNVLQVTPTVFVPPYENFNEDTLLALKENNISHISSTIKNDPPPYQLSNVELHHFPSGAATGRLNPESGIVEPVPYEETYSEVQKNLEQYGFAVVTIGAPEFSEIQNNDYFNQADEQKIQELELLIKQIQDDGFKIVPVGKIDLHSGGISIPDWVRNNAGWWADGQIGDSDFVSGIQFLINKEIIRIPATAESAETTDEIPSWIKNNAGWWAQGVITDSDFVSGIQWLIANGIIKIGGLS